MALSCEKITHMIIMILNDFFCDFLRENKNVSLRNKGTLDPVFV